VFSEQHDVVCVYGTGGAWRGRLFTRMLGAEKGETTDNFHEAGWIEV